MPATEPRTDHRPTSGATRWDHLLTFAVVVLGASGLFFVVAQRATETIFEWMVFGTDHSPVAGDDARSYVRFVAGVLGAVMVGWAAALWPLVRGPVRRRERWAWTGVAGSLAVWFAVDTTMSIASGFPENAVLNLAFGVLFAIPLAGMHRELPPHDGPRAPTDPTASTRPR